MNDVPAPPLQICVEVVYCAAPGEVDRRVLHLAVGATVLHALRASGVLERHSQIELATQRIGLWGRLAKPGDMLREGDRVEVYRPLTVDPKEARRQRYKGQRATQRR